MQWYGILGSGLIAWSPLAAVLFGVLSKHPQLVMVGMAASFVFVIASHFCATVWHILPPLQDSTVFHCLVGVAITEGFRYIVYRLYEKCEQAFGKRFGEVVYLTEFSVIPAALAAGVGWAASQSLLSFGIIFAYHLDPTVTEPDATWYSDDCKSIPVLFFQSLQTLFYSICNMSWMVTAFAAYYSLRFTSTSSPAPLPYHKMGNPLSAKHASLLLAATLLLHLSGSLFTLVSTTDAGCAASLPLLCLVTVFSGLLAVSTTRLMHAPLKQESEATTGARVVQPDPVSDTPPVSPLVAAPQQSPLSPSVPNQSELDAGGMEPQAKGTDDPLE
eukprot:TRINITY_DN3135_c2_g2_i1.p1 TRINITY_DN3135_c2_g2~~TRINITY_DN3135_c2_g2_i1.p1  ORF type:complete len:330 (+),score=33.80 TRINITY_DN3135_c2_g2_i1:82-1071(+)